MKTDLARPQTGYRNDVVFRSAERLITSTPKKRVRERFPRWAIFAAGLGLGIGLTIAGRTLWRSDQTESASEQSPGEILFHAPWARRTVAKSVNTVPTPTTAATPAVAAGEQTESSEAPAQETPQGRASGSAAFASSTPGSPTDPSTRADLALRETPAIILTSVTQYFTEFTWRGELDSAAVAPMTVEFFVRSLDKSDPNNLVGFVDFLNGDFHFAGNRIEGKIVNRTLTLHETKNLWKINVPSFLAGRTYVIQLPADPGTTNEITGTWSFGSLNGTLALTSVVP